MNKGSGFPENFLWGCASAAYQVEGAYLSDGKEMSVWDQWVRIPGKTFAGTTGDIAADHYHRYREDVALMKELGLKAYRFSLSWSRIFPQGSGSVNEAGLKFYHNLIDELVKNDIEPIVTLYHWDLPLALQDNFGGWESAKIVEHFLHFARTCFDSFGDRVRYWIILNEPNIFTMLGYLMGLHPPGKKDLKLYMQTYHLTAVVHASVVKLFKDGGYKGSIGSSIAFTPAYAASESAEDKKALANYYHTNCWWLMDIYCRGEYPREGIIYAEKAGIMPDISSADHSILKEGAKLADFIGINYYQTATIAHNPANGVSLGQLNTSGDKGTQKEIGIPGLYKQVRNPNLEYTDWDWAIDPDGLRYGLLQLKERYGLPVLISENGLGAFDKVEEGIIYDPYRIDFIKKHIEACSQALAAGVELWGYCIWSYTDLFSWLNGYRKRYGLVHIDFESGSLHRSKKESYFWYKNVIASNGRICLTKD